MTVKKKGNKMNNATDSETIVRCPNCGTINYIYPWGTMFDRHYCKECGEEI